MSTREFTFTLRLRIESIIEKEVSQEDLWQRLWIVTYDRAFPSGTNKREVVEIAKHAVAEDFNVPYEQLVGTPAQLPFPSGGQIEVGILEKEERRK